ncbi:MAG: G5 domain-containing protein [Finegoldia magna]|nr:G5 domain-containing protein [Finegoldia magna]
MKINKKLLMAALASAVIVSAPQVKTYADKQTDSSQAVTEKLIDDQLANAAQPAEQKNSEKAQAETEANADEKQNQQENSELKSEKEINSQKTGFGSQALNHPAQATAVTGLGNNANNSGLELGEEKQPAAVQAGETGAEEEKNLQKADDPNYGEDEAKIKNFDENEHYRSTQMEQGAGPTASFDNLDKENEFVDGYRYKTLEPSPTSPDKAKWGFEIEIDKEKGQRTYTDFAFTNSGLMGAYLDKGSVPAKSPEDGAIGDSFKTPNYKATTEIEINGSGKQRNLNAVASEEDLKRINNINNKNTTMAWEGHYKVEDPKGPRATTGSSASFTFTVNPWPNENDKLQIIKLNGSHDQKEFVQGQLIDTGVKVENLDDNAKERLVGQVYNPKTGKVVPGAKAYIDENGNVKVQMPEGAVDKNGNINKNSIFTQDEYKGIQNLEVKFFARPRTEAEFRAVGVKANYGEDKYTQTGAGTATIKHKGKDVVIDKQGFDRYDHYNLIGKFNINLDDTRYYDQDFYNGDKKKTEGHTFNDVKAGDPYEIKGIGSEAKNKYELTIDGENPKTAEEMQDAVAKGEASVEIDQKFIDTQNANLKPENRWIVEPSKEKGSSNFTITPPKTSQPGDHFSVPLTYTYTNGSTDVHWFHFVVKKSDNNAPKYRAKAGFEGTTITSKPKLAESKEGVPDPQEYILEKNTYKDEKGNEWTVSVDENGAVTATIPKGNIEGGESIEVPVKVKYIDKNGNVEYENNKVEFFAMPLEDAPKYETKTKDEKKSDIPFETIVEYDENLAEGELKEVQAGVKGELTTSFIQDTLNDKKGIFQEDGSFKEGESKIVAEVTKKPTPRIIKIGTKPATETVKIPRGLEYELDYSRKDGDPEVVEDGNDGEITVTTKRDPKTGVITMEQNVTTEAKNKKIKIPAGTEGTHEYKEKIPYKYDIKYDENLKSGEYVIDVAGQEGEKTTKWTIKNSKVVGEPTTNTTNPVDAKIRVGNKDYTGVVTHEVKEEIPFTVKVIEDETLEAGKSEVVTQGVPGEKTTKYTQNVKNGEADGELKSESSTTKEPVQHVIKVGKKPATNNVEEKTDVPVDIVYKYDQNMDVTMARKGDFTPGTVKTVVTNKYNPETGKIESVKETVVTNAKQEIVVGTKKYTGEFKNEINEEIAYETQVIFDEELDAGTLKVDQAGKTGNIKKEFIQHFVNGEQKSTEEKVIERTEPEKRIVRVGSKTEGEHQHKEKIPFKYTVKYDPEMKAGTYEEVTPGRDGERVTIWKIKNSKIVGEPTTVETKPVDAVIKVGSKDFTGSFETKKTKAVEFETEYIVDNSLEPGTTEVVQKGELGEEETIVTHKIKNGEVTESKEGDPNKTKAPVKRIVKVGPAKTDGQYKETETIPFETEIRKDSSLKKGEWKYAEVDGVQQTGESGLKERTITIVNSKVTEESEYKTTKEPKKAVILVGDEDFTGEVKHKEHFEIPFEVEVRYNKDLPAGKTNEIQKGVKGSYDVEYTQKIKNGSADGEMTKEESNKVEAKKHIIEVGTKVETPENNYSKEVEVEVEYVYDDTKDKGVVETGEFTPGKVETKVVDKYNPETGKVEQTTEEVVTKAKQKVIVGTKDFTGKYEYKKTCPIPIEVEIKEDPTLKKGEKVVDQEGKAGSKTTSYEQAIKNGQPDGEAKKISEEVTEQPTKHIVRIGTKESEGETTKTIEREIPYETKVIYDKDLEAGTQKIEKEGKPGKEEVTITQKIKDSKPVGEATETTKTITEKEDRVVRIGVKAVVKETELGNNTEYRHNPELKAGETKVIAEGSKGSVKYTTTFNKETGKLEVKEERTEPKNKVVEYGSKTDGEFKYESEKAYDIIIRENPNLEAGKTNVIQEGKPGKTETTVKIENSKEVSRDTKTITEKQDKIIEIGTKNVCEIPPVKPEEPKPEQPGKEDPTKPDKEDPTKPGKEDPTKPGKEDPTKPGKEDPTKPGKEDSTKPGKEDSTKPGKEDSTKPGKENPANPGTPGENKPNEPGTPGKTPEENGKTPEENGKTPENNGKTPENNGKTPENNGKTPDNSRGDSPNKPNETPKTPETTEQEKRKEKADIPNRRSANKLPKAGSESEIMMLSMSALMTAAGFIGLKKKRKDR